MNLDSTRERRPSHGFGWVDRRVVSGGHLAAMTQTEAAVYLLLCVVADRHGISYYHPATLGKLVHHPENRVRTALDSLQERGLIAAAGRLVQVLDLGLVGQPPAGGPKVPVPATAARQDETAIVLGAQQGGTPSLDPREQQPPATEILARLPAERREQLLAEARAEFAKFLGSRSPNSAAVAGLAAGMALRRGEV